ncbi:hypothetical protein QFC21_006053 [Naganishia friedmannii]|uniref:Uncharacterized protein n=1 Tax=Naganishia friedmannii TaxID=89922 RepID=A0ACC2V5E8_9TREE|nr:hypothetical protein QFC21_006053 [Naganishia friedmannii]
MHSSNRSFVARHGKLVTEMQEASARVSHLEDEKKQMVREMTSLKKELKSSKKEIQDLVQRSGRLEHDVEVLVKERVDNGLALHDLLT